MDDRTRRGWLFAICCALIAAALTADPNARGPLAFAVDYWLAEQDDRARAEFERAVPTLEDLGIDPSFLILPTKRNASAIAPIAGRIDLQVLRIALDRTCHDERSAAIFMALALARGGDRASARNTLAQWTTPNRPSRFHALCEALAPP